MNLYYKFLILYLNIIKEYVILPSLWSLIFLHVPTKLCIHILLSLELKAIIEIIELITQKWMISSERIRN